MTETNENNTKVISVPKISYPKKGIEHWRTEISDEDRLRVINMEDFPLEAILKSLGLFGSKLAPSFGINDCKEICRRQTIIRFLLDNPELMDYFLNFNEGNCNLPSCHDCFLDFFNTAREHNPYWQQVHNLVLLLCNAKGDLPASLKEFLEVIGKSIILEDAEKELASSMIEQIKDITVIEGILKYTFSTLSKKLNTEERNSWGRKQFSSAVNDVYIREDREWTKDKRNPLNWLGIGKLVNLFDEVKLKLSRHVALSPDQIRETPREIERDIFDALMDLLRRIDWAVVSPDDNVVIEIYYRYGKDGLSIIPFTVTPERFANQSERIADSFYSRFCNDHNPYEYTPVQWEEMKQAQKDFFKTVAKRRCDLESAQLQLKIEAKHPYMFHKEHEVPSPKTDSKYRWFALSNIYAQKQFTKAHDAIRRHREFLKENVTMLYSIAQVASRIKKKSDELGTDICKTEIFEGEDGVVSFDGKIIPIQLLTQPGMNVKDIVPVGNLPVLNGQIIGLTGLHGKGKTESSLALLANIWLAQSGIPPLGTGTWRQNVKDTIGCVFIEPGKGSTCQKQVLKIKKLLEALGDTKPGRVVFVLDELGSATQEMDGLKFGQDVLATLNSQHISTLFSTQITGLAKWAETELGAQCFQLTADRQIKPGIGDGGMNQLRQETGIDAYLIKTKK